MKLLPQLLQQLPVHLVVQVAQHRVRAGAAAHLVALHGEVRVPDAAAQKRHVGHRRLHKTVVGAPEHLAVRRLPHAPGRVLLGVDQRPAGYPLHQQQRLAQQHGGDDVVPVGADVALPKGDETVDEVLHLRHALHLVRPQLEPEGPHPLQGPVQAEAVDDPDPGPAAADHIVPADHVAAAAHPQGLVAPVHVLPVVV